MKRMTEPGDSAASVHDILTEEMRKRSAFLDHMRPLDPPVPMTSWQVLRCKITDWAGTNVWQRLHDWSARRGADCYYDD